MYLFEEIGLNYLDLLIMIIICIASFFFTNWIFPKYISYAKKKNWMGKDIHKKSRPEVAESGGIVFIIGIIPASLVVIVLFPEIRNESIVFMFTILFSGLIGFIDDRKVLSSTKKLVLMILTGAPIFILNWFGYIEINSPVIPILGQLRLTIIYPIVTPFIIAILTNLVNMLEGYNGEGSGTGLIVFLFLLIGSFISRSSQGVIYTIIILGALAAFFKYNKFPAKVFPGDVGTLALGAAIGCVSIFGSIEVAMFCCVLVHLFNGFYVIASIKGLKERRSIKTTDIYMTDDDIIEASKGFEDHLTLPRLILAQKPLKEPELVKHFWILGIIGGMFSLVAEVVKQWTLGSIDFFTAAIISLLIVVVSIPIIIKYKAIRGIAYFMLALLSLGVFFLFIIDMYIVHNPLNWLITGVIAGSGFFYWYYLTVKYFWYKISKMTGIKNEIKLIPFIKKTINDILGKILSKITSKKE